MPTNVFFMWFMSLSSFGVFPRKPYFRLQGD
jgi:hypothetical protein